MLVPPWWTLTLLLSSDVFLDGKARDQDKLVGTKVSNQEPPFRVE